MSALDAWLIAPLSHEFMQRGLLVAVLVGVVCAVLSCFLILKGWSLMGDAVSHAVLPGIVLAQIAGLPLAAGAFVAGLSCSLAIGYLKENSRVKEDTVMGIVFSGMFALGLVMFVKVESDQHLLHILFGNMLGVRWSDLAETALIAVPTIVIMLALRRDFLLVAFDPAHCAGDRPSRALAEFRPADAAGADDRGRAQGCRHHPRCRHADRTGRDRLPDDAAVRRHAGRGGRGRDRLERHRDDPELSSRWRNRALHRGGAGGVLPGGAGAQSPPRVQARHRRLIRRPADRRPPGRAKP
ncbi:hypothetical protein ABIE41_001664 [Bosea sp. OAE506]